MFNTPNNLDTNSESGSKELFTIDRLIETESDLLLYLADLRKRGVNTVGFDMEGDQGLFRYDYSISIFQCFDGLESVIIDVIKIGNKPGLHEFLTCADIVKLMFSCPNDVFMAQNVLGCTITPIRDIAVGQKLLGLPINLSDYLKIDKAEKDSFQRANWLRRPVRPELLQYAINDVLELFKIEQELVAKLHDGKLYERYIEESMMVCNRNFVVNQFDQYQVKFPGFKRLRPDKKRLAGNVWIFRELLGKHFDSPVGYLLSKKALANAIIDPENIVYALEFELNRGRKPEKKLNRGLVERFYNQAVAMNKR